MALDYGFKPFSGVGITTLYEYNPATGQALGGGFDCGEVSKLDLGGNSPKVEMNTSRVISRGVAYSMAQSKAGTVSIELKTISDPILALLTDGVWSEAAAGALVTDWPMPTGLVAGQIVKLPHQNVTLAASNAIVDSAGSPATLVAGTHYEVQDAFAGTIKILNVTGLTQPFKVDYTPGAVKVLAGLKAAQKDYIIGHAGVNAYDGEKVYAEVFKFRPAADGAFSMIATDFGTFQISGSMQLDETKAANSVGGQYYKLLKAGA